MANQQKKSCRLRRRLVIWRKHVSKCYMQKGMGHKKRSVLFGWPFANTKT